MATLDNLLIVGVRVIPDAQLVGFQEGMIRYYLNIWNLHNPDQPHAIPVPYRGGYIGGFNDLTALDRYLLVADGEGILPYDLADPSRGYSELRGVDELSCLIAKTPNYLVSCLDNLIQLRSLHDIIHSLGKSSFNNEQVDVPIRETQHQGEGDTALSMIAIPNTQHELVLLNNAVDKTYLINPVTLETMTVQFKSKQEFPYTFQRREQYHFIPAESSKHLIFTESTSDDKHPNRVYSFDIRGPPTITELEPLELEGRQIISMLPSNKDFLTLLTNQHDHSYVETLDPIHRQILHSRPLSRQYDLGDRLHQVGGDLLIVRHLKSEIVDAESEQSITLTGAENDVPIPEISSTWEVPQYLYVTRYPPNDKKRKK